MIYIKRKKIDLLIKLFTVMVFWIIFLNSPIFYTNTNNTKTIESPYTKDTIKSNDITFGGELILGQLGNPSDLDPQSAWDKCSIDLIDQVCEGLFMYNLSDPDFPIIPILAADYGVWTSDVFVNYTVDLRTNVQFHDGSSFDAYDVEWTFDRLTNLNSSGLVKAHSLYEYYDTVKNKYKPIINDTIAVDSDTIKFVLNTPYVPLLDLLTFPASYILPSEGQVPFNDLLNLSSDDLIGTGPFDFQEFIPNDKVRFDAFNNYWRGKTNIDHLTFKINPANINQALMNGEIDIILDPHQSYYSIFNSSSDIKLVDVGNSTEIQYLGMNNKNIPVNVRKAISYAINYTYIIKDMVGGHAERLKSPIPEGITYANWFFDVPTMNITKSRTAMQDAGYGLGLDPTYGGPDEELWNSASFVTYNYSYNIGNSFRQDIFILLQNNLSKIGISVIDGGTTWKEFTDILFEREGRSRDSIDLFWFERIPDYIDPSTFINPLFTNRSVANNAAQVNDSQVQAWMEQALVETNPSLRKQLYDQIQQRLIEEVYPLCWGFVPHKYDAHNIKLTGYPSNIVGKTYFYPCSIDKKAPSVEIESPMNLVYNSNQIDINATCYDYSNISQVIAEIDSTTNITLTQGTGNLYYYETFMFSEGGHSIRFYAEDDFGNWNDTETISFAVDTLPPDVVILSPINKTYNYKQMDIAVTSVDPSGILQLIAEIDGKTNISLTDIGFGAFYGLTPALDDGIHNIRIYAYSIGGNLNDTEFVEFTVDDTDPSVSIINPKNTVYGKTQIDINATCTDASGIAQVIAEIDSTTNIILTQGIGDLYYNDSYSFSEGAHTVRIFANDTYKNLNDQESISFSVDLSSPIIIINEPTGEYSDVPNYNISVSDLNLDEIWYTMDGGTNNRTITNLNGDLDDNLWNQLPDGEVTLTFYASDTAGNIGSQSVTINKTSNDGIIPGFDLLIILG
ncbi:MAG: ABC transporter substrate-binding protein, partial [Promethearchaeota archaeon]